MSTPPSPLPKWLPPGTIARYPGNTYIAKTSCEHRGPGYYAVWDGTGLDRETWCQPDSIDWESIPDTGPRGRMENHDGVELYVPAVGELVQIIDTSFDSAPSHETAEVVVVKAVQVCLGDAEQRQCLLLTSVETSAYADPEERRSQLGTYCLVKPLFEAPAEPKKEFDPEAWERARAEAEAAFGGAPAVEGPSGVMMVNGVAYELKDCRVDLDDYVISYDPGVYASLEDAVRAKGFKPGELLLVEHDYSLSPGVAVQPIGVAAKVIPAGALVARDKNGNLVPAQASPAQVGRVTRIKRP